MIMVGRQPRTDYFRNKKTRGENTTGTARVDRTRNGMWQLATDETAVTDGELGAPFDDTVVPGVDGTLTSRDVDLPGTNVLHENMHVGVRLHLETERHHRVAVHGNVFPASTLEERRAATRAHVRLLLFMYALWNASATSASYFLTTQHVWHTSKHTNRQVGRAGAFYAN